MAVALHKPKGATGDVALREQIPVGMRMLSPSGLSEQWLLRTCGDIHWEMIAQALGQQDTVFHDAEGRAVYAAFCATDLQLERPRKMLLGTSLDIRLQSAYCRREPDRVRASFQHALGRTRHP